MGRWGFVWAVLGGALALVGSVAGNAFSEATVTSSASSSVPLTVTGYNDGTANLFEVVYVSSSTPSTELYVDADGDLFVKGGAVGSSSDRRLKENITTIPGALEKVSRLRGTYFNWKTSGKFDMGFIAQEVQDVEPLLVLKPSSGEDMDILNVNYLKVGPLLVEAVKELQEQVQDLHRQVNDLRAAGCASNDG